MFSSHVSRFPISLQGFLWNSWLWAALDHFSCLGHFRPFWAILGLFGLFNVLLLLMGSRWYKTENLGLGSAGLASRHSPQNFRNTYFWDTPCHIPINCRIILCETRKILHRNDNGDNNGKERARLRTVEVRLIEYQCNLYNR